MSSFEKEVIDWLAQNDYEVVQTNERIAGQSIQYSVPIHAMTVNKEWLGLSKHAVVIGAAGLLLLGVGLLLPWISTLLKLLGWLLVVFGLFLVAMLGAGLSYYLKMKDRKEEHVWIEFKEGKRRVNQTQIQKFYAMFSNFQRENRKIQSLWYPRYVLFFSSNGFSENALKWARQSQIECWGWDSNEERFILGGGSPEFPESEDSESGFLSSPPALPNKPLLQMAFYGAIGLFLFAFLLTLFVKSRGGSPSPAHRTLGSLTHSPPLNFSNVKVGLRSHSVWQKAQLALKNKQFEKAAGAFRQLQSLPFPIYPRWRLLAYESAALARARQLTGSKHALKASEVAYRTWKKQLRQRGGSLLYYMRLESHAAIGDAHWYMAQVTYGKTRLFHLGEVWIEWPLSRWAGRAQALWWQGVTSGKFGGGLKASQLYYGAKTYALAIYRRYRRAERLLTYVIRTKSRRWKRIASLRLIGVYLDQQKWSQAFRLARSFQRSFRGRYDRRYRSKVQRMQALAAYHLQGIRGFERAVALISSKDKSQPIRAYYALAVAQLEEGKYAIAQRSFQRLIAQAKGWRLLAAKWYLGVCLYAQRNFAGALQVWSQTSPLAMNDDWRIRLLHWTQLAAQKAGRQTQAKTLRRRLCTDFKLSYFGMKACRALSIKVSLSERGFGSWFPTRTIQARLAKLQTKPTAQCLEYRRQLYEEPRPSTGLIERTAFCLSKQNDWKLSFQILKNHRFSALQRGSLSRQLVKVMFPLPKAVWPRIQSSSRNKGVEPYLAAAIIRRESDFLPSERFASRIGIMGLDPIWSTRLPSNLSKNLVVGLTRLRRLISVLGIELGVASYRGYEKRLVKLARIHSSAPSEIRVELGPHKSWEYVRGPRSGIMWYYGLYKWLYTQ